MYELSGRLLPGVSFTAKGKPIVMMVLNERESTGKMFDELQVKELSIKISEYKQKRSINANAYLWKLCSMIADKLSDEGVPHTKDEIYRKAIKARGIYREQGELPVDFAKTSRTAWEMLGVGWITEQVDFEPDGDRVVVRFYYGSSTYNTKQMSRIVEWLVEESRQLGLEVKPKEEIDSLLSSWKGGI